jgi:hypothetical protein
MRIKNTLSICSIAGAAGVHAVGSFVKESVFAAGGDLLVTPKLSSWMSHSDWLLLCVVGVTLVVLQFWEEHR